VALILVLACSSTAFFHSSRALLALLFAFKTRIQFFRVKLSMIRKKYLLPWSDIGKGPGISNWIQLSLDTIWLARVLGIEFFIFAIAQTSHISRSLATLPRLSRVVTVCNLLILFGPRCQTPLTFFLVKFLCWSYDLIFF
jgi:hypothetical protein